MKIQSILFVEDDRYIGEMYVRSLERSAFEVVWVTDGGQAMELLTKNRFDLILLDIMVPLTRGHDLVDYIRKNPSPNSASKIIIMTNFEQDSVARSKLQGQVDAYLIKAETTPTMLINTIKLLAS